MKVVLQLVLLGLVAFAVCSASRERRDAARNQLARKADQFVKQRGQSQVIDNKRLRSNYQRIKAGHPGKTRSLYKGIRPSNEHEVRAHQLQIRKSFNKVRSSERVSGGESAMIADYPYTVAIYQDNGYLCTGSVLNENYVVVAASCFDNAISGVTTVYVIAGATNISDSSDPNMQVTVSDYIQIHGQYREGIFRNDIAVMSLLYPLNLTTAYVGNVTLPTTANDGSGTSATLLGWGYPDADGPTSDVLLKTTLSIFNNSNCANAYSYFDSRTMLCAGNTLNSDGICNGDGPLMGDNNVVLGLTSFRDSCNSTNPSGFTRVSTYTTWIGVAEVLLYYCSQFNDC